MQKGKGAMKRCTFLMRLDAVPFPICQNIRVPSPGERSIFGLPTSQDRKWKKITAGLAPPPSGTTAIRKLIIGREARKRRTTSLMIWERRQNGAIHETIMGCI